jgi:hypothetical protein
MGVGGSMNKSENESQSSFEDWASQNIDETQLGALKGLWDQGSAWLNDNQAGLRKFADHRNAYQHAEAQGAGQNMREMNQGSQNAWNDQLQGGVYGGHNLGTNLGASLTQSLNNPSAMQGINSMIMGGDGNNYADAMKDQYMQDADRTQKQMLANTDARASAAGMSGGSRHGMQQGMGNEAISKNLQSNLANTGFQTFDKDLNRKLNIAQQADQGTLQRQQMMQQMLGQQQQGIQNAIGGTGNMQSNAQNPYNMAHQFTQDALGNATNTAQDGMSWLANLIGGPIVLDSSGSTGNSSSSGSSFGMGASAGK